MSELKDGLYVPLAKANKLLAKFTQFDNNGLMHCLYEVKNKVIKFPYGAKNYVTSYTDNTNSPKITDSLNPNITLREDQKLIVEKVLNNPQGILFSPPGSGKTVMGCYIINQLHVKTIILVPTLYLLTQWVERIQTFLGYTPGIIGNGNCIIKDITIAIFNSALSNLELIKDAFGLVLVDEAHRIAAETYKEVVGNINSKYKIGLTGTLQRKDGKEFIVTAFLGDVIHENTVSTTLKPIIILTLVNLYIPKITYTKALNFLAENELYNNAILNNLINNYEKRLQLALTFRKNQLSYLKDKLPNCLVLSGDSTAKDREQLLTNVEDFKIVLATTVLDEGADIGPLDTLHLCSPFNNIPKLEQRIARITRTYPNKKQPVVYDYWVKGGGSSWSPIAQQNMRLNYYLSKNYKVYKQL